MDWQNRIVGTGTKAASQFLANPLNWRVHPVAQQEALEGVLSEVGWVQGVIENVRTGHLIDGHQRVLSALKHGDEAEVPVTYVDLSVEEERLILATLDPLAIMAAEDATALDRLLDETTATPPALQALLQQLREVQIPTFTLEPIESEKKIGVPGLVDLVKSDPVHVVERHDVWQVHERHTLVCADVVKDVPLWRAYLTDHVWFLPYAGPFAFLTNSAQAKTFLVVHPVPYICGHILDKVAVVHGAGAVRKVVSGGQAVT